ncbi:MAG: hypothetical protein ACRBCJ_09160 [Hyphomicrobiaceae bacterium]
MKTLHWSSWVFAVATVCWPIHIAYGQSPDPSEHIYVLQRAEQTKNGKVAEESPGLIERATPFGKKNSTIKYYRRFSFEDGKINVILKDKKNVGAIDNPKMIRFGQDSEFNIQYSPPPKTLLPGKNILITASWSARAQIGCYKNGGVKPSFKVLLYEVRERKEKVAQENLRASALRLSRDELKKNCKNKSKISKSSSGGTELLLKPSTNKVPAKSLLIRMEGPGSLGMLYHYALRPVNEVQLAQAEPVAAAPEKPQEDARACNYDREIVDIEKRANLQTRRGQILRRLMKLDLPELPVLDFCLASGGNKIELQLKDSDSYAQDIVDFTENLQNAFGFLGNAASIADRGLMTVTKFDDLVVETLGELGSKVARSFRFIAGSGEDFSSTMSTALNLVRDGVLATKATSNPEEVVAFVNETVGIFPTVLKARKQMICRVKRGVPDFYFQVAELEKTVTKLKKDIAANSGCSSGDKGRTLGDKLSKVADIKMRNVRKLQKWLAEGIIKPPNAGSTTFTSRHSWVDRRITADYQSEILVKTSCR